MNKLNEIIQDLLATMGDWFLAPFKSLPSLKQLIFGGNDNLAFLTFTEKEITNVYQPGLNIFTILAVSVLLISIVLAGMKISSTGINPANRTYAFEYFKEFLIVAILFGNLYTIYAVLFISNQSIVQVFTATKDISSLKDAIDMGSGSGVLGNLAIQLVKIGLGVWAYFYYQMRKFTLMLLLITGPLMITFYLIPQTKGITLGWAKELIGTVFIQSIHAAVYWIMATMTTTVNGLEGVILMMIFIPVSEGIRSLIGLGGNMNNNFARTAAMFGGSALMGMYGAARGAMKGTSVTEALQKLGGRNSGNRTQHEKGSGTDEEKGLASNLGTDIGSTTRAEKMLKAGDIVSKGGKAVFGAAGTLIGSPMGPMGSIAGSTAGFYTGGVIGGVAGRAGMAGAQIAGNRVKTGLNALSDKFTGLKNAESKADEKAANSLADLETTKWANENHDAFMKDFKERFPDAHESSVQQAWNNEKADKHGEFLNNARKNIGAIKKNEGQNAKANDLINSSKANLTKEWANANKESFMKDYDRNNPLPSNPTGGQIQNHKAQKESAWQQAVANKSKEIGSHASQVATELGNGTASRLSFINKDAFNENLSNRLDSNKIISNGSGSLSSVQSATSGVKGTSLYSNGGREINVPYLKDQISNMKIDNAKEQFLNNATNSGVSKENAIMRWNQSGKAEQIRSSVASTMPALIPLDHKVINNTLGRYASAAGSSVIAGVVGASGVKEVGQFVGDTKIGQAAKTFVPSVVSSFKQQVPSTGHILTSPNPVGTFASAGLTALQDGGKAVVNTARTHVADNVVGKQVAFKNTVAFATGVIGGVKGYQTGATYAAGSSTNTKAYGLKGFNPYNNAVQQQIKEVSDIAHIAQTVTGPDGQARIADGAIQMVTTSKDTILQVRDKTGQTQTVSRIASGHSGLKQDQKVYQELTIENGHLTPSSNFYQYDSGGGKIPAPAINVNPNKIVANRNTPKNPRAIQEVQSYNQLVDSGQYHLNDAMNEMSDIRMVIDRNRSYLVGQKDGKDYRISPYGEGDARIQVNEVVTTACDTRNRKLVPTKFIHRNEQGYEINETFTTSLKPEDLVSYRPVNKRNLIRRQNEQNRNKAFTGSLRY